MPMKIHIVASDRPPTLLDTGAVTFTIQSLSEPYRWSYRWHLVFRWVFLTVITLHLVKRSEVIKKKTTPSQILDQFLCRDPFWKLCIIYFFLWIRMRSTVNLCIWDHCSLMLMFRPFCKIQGFFICKACLNLNGLSICFKLLRQCHYFPVTYPLICSRDARELLSKFLILMSSCLHSSIYM